MAALDVPRTYHTETPDLANRELARLASSVLTLAARVGSDVTEVPTTDTKPYRSGAVPTEFGTLTRILPGAGDTAYVKLPTPTAVDAGKEISLVRMATSGTIIIESANALVNKASSVTLAGHVGCVTFVTDGEGWYCKDSGMIA